MATPIKPVKRARKAPASTPPPEPPQVKKRTSRKTAMATGVNLTPETTGGTASVLDAVMSPPKVVTEGAVETKRKAKSSEAIRTYLFTGAGVEEGVDVTAVAGLARKDSHLVWVDLSEYAKGDLTEVGEILKLHPLTVRSTLADWDRPRVDVFPDYFYMTLSVVRADQRKRKLVAAELNVIVGHNYLVTAHKLPLPFHDQVMQRLRQSPEIATMHTAYALYIILDELIEHYEGMFEHIDEEIENTEELALTSSSDAFLEDLLSLKRYIFLLGRFAEQHRSVFAVLTRPDFTNVSGEDIEPYFKDLQEDLGRLVDKLTSARESVTEAFDIYVSQVSHRTNQLIRVLTLISTVTLPASLVLGFFATGFTRYSALTSIPALVIMLVLLVVVPGGILLFIRARKLI